MKIYVFGAGGHGKVVCDILQSSGQAVQAFVDDKKAGEVHFGLPIMSESQLGAGDAFSIVVAIGVNHIRSKVVSRLKQSFPKAVFLNAIHPTACLAKSAKLGVGNVICAGAIIGPDARVGDHCVINTGAQADHDCDIADFVSLAPGAILGGGAVVENSAYISLGAGVIHGTRIGAHSVVGSGSTVVRDLDSFVVAYGTPCRVVRKREKEDSYL